MSAEQRVGEAGECTTAACDAAFMRRALELAELGRGRVAPNPLVGAVIVKNGRLIGEGAHLRYGEAHAEVNALDSALNNARGSTLGCALGSSLDAAAEDVAGGTMYVTLEPCNHYGKTPPCTEAVLKAGISRVVVASLDVNPQMQGKSVQLLREKGVEVVTGVLEKEAWRQNEVFRLNMLEQRAFVTIKAAISLDGRIAAANRKSQWITGPEARNVVHELRSSHAAVMVGAGTLLADNPALTARHRPDAAQPRRIILTPRTLPPEDLHIFHQPGQEKPILLSAQPESAFSRKLCELAEIWPVSFVDGILDFTQLSREFWQRGLASVLVEGGSRLYTELIRQGVYDKFNLFIAPCLIGADGLPLWTHENRDMKSVIRLSEVRWQQLGQDMMLEASPNAR
jgi:diaminohydroxyphosphoribosylaminopyrimidine deaminase/5-amino-6-(5-phosphoribosylamino)uracil reductase